MQWIKKFTRLRWILILLGAAVISIIVIFIIEDKMKDYSFPGALDLQYGFSYETAYSQIGEYGNEVKTFYTYLQILDIVFLIAYGLLLAALIKLVYTKLFPERTRIGHLAVLGIAAAAGDLIENIGIFIMIRKYPSPFPVFSAFASAAGLIKAVLFYLSVFVIIVGAIMLLVRKISEKKSGI